VIDSQPVYIKLKKVQVFLSTFFGSRQTLGLKKIGGTFTYLKMTICGTLSSKAANRQ